MAQATSHTLVARDLRLDMAAVPLVMGILNATPDSFSDPGPGQGFHARTERGLELLADGADLLDVGGESGVTNRPAGRPARGDRARRAADRRSLSAQGAVVSVDTYKPAVAAAAIEAGAAIVNDPSGLIDPAMADVCASSGAALVVTHTRARPKQKLARPRYDDVVDDVKALSGRAARGRTRGRRARRAAPGLPRPRPRQGPGADDRAAAPPRRAARAGPADPARRLAQGLRRRAHGPCAPRSGWPARSRPSRTASTAGRTSCGSTTSPRRGTS